MKYEEIKEVNEIKQIVNEIIKTFVYTPWCIYIKRITQDEIDLIACENEKAIRLSCRTWQDNYFNELAERARLDIYTFPHTAEKGDHLYISSQYVPLWEEQPDGEYNLIERVIKTFYEISLYHKKMKQLARESPDISPGSPRAKLSHEFYNKEWEI